MDVAEEDYEDLGWKTVQESEKNRSKKGKGKVDAESAAAIAEEKRQEEATVRAQRNGHISLS